jgi:hypothetical protein
MLLKCPTSKHFVFSYLGIATIGTLHHESFVITGRSLVLTDGSFHYLPLSPLKSLCGSREFARATTFLIFGGCGLHSSSWEISRQLTNGAALALAPRNVNVAFSPSFRRTTSSAPRP